MSALARANSSSSLLPPASSSESQLLSSLKTPLSLLMLSLLSLLCSLVSSSLGDATLLPAAACYVLRRLKFIERRREWNHIYFGSAVTSIPNMLQFQLKLWEVGKTGLACRDVVFRTLSLSSASQVTYTRNYNRDHASMR